MKVREKIVVECETHWMRSLIPILLLLFSLWGAVIFLFSGKFTDFGIMLVPVFVCTLVILIQQKTSYLRMTETAIIGKVGLIRTKKMASPISKVNDVSIHSGLFGKIFGYSTVHISTAGSIGAEYTFKYVKGGKAFQQEFLTRVQ